MVRRLVPLILAAAALLFEAAAQQSPAVTSVEITPASAEAQIGQQLKFTAIAKDAAGKQLDLKPLMWLAAPFDLAVADPSGTVTVYGAGEVRVGVVIGGKIAFATVTVKPAPITRIQVAPVGAQVVTGGVVKLTASAFQANGDPRADVRVTWTSKKPGVATVDEAGMVGGVAPGVADIVATSGNATTSVKVRVVRDPVRRLAIVPKSASARTGDVVAFKASAYDRLGARLKDHHLSWAVSGEGASIWPDGGFVAERPGTYVITASTGTQAATASVLVTARDAEREIEVVGRAPVKEVQAAEQWVFGKHVFLSSISDQVLVYDISDPANPKLTDSVKVDARIVNDVSTTADGRIGVLSREGASSRKNGIVFLDTSDPAHPKVVSEYTKTVSGGVHSAFVDSHYVYLTDDATGSMRVIDFKDLKNPKEVGRWQVENPLVRPTRSPLGDESMGGRYLHDVQVVDGLAYLAYWRDGLIILDVGKGIKGGSPENPKFVSQLRFNYHELYGDGWLAGAHAVYRYKNYVFVGDEVFPAEFNILQKTRIPVRGIVHVVDVGDIYHPRKVAEYNVPEAGAHNIWVKDDIMYMGYYSGGGRIVDVSGELRGDLYRQGREIARLWTGDPQGYRPNLPFTWGAQPHGDLVFFNDINSGLWIVRLGKPKYKGSAPAPGT